MATMLPNLKKTIAPYAKAQSLLKKIEDGKTLSSSERKDLVKLSEKGSGLKDTKFLNFSAGLKSKVTNLVKGKDFSKEALRAVEKEEKKQLELSEPTKTPTIAEAKGQTTTYLDSIAEQQKKLAKGYTSKLSQQTSAYEKQLKTQSNFLNSQIDKLTKQSASQVQNYETMLTRITSQQQTELQAMRQSFNQQNKQSESVIANLQSEIDRLSQPLKPPVIDVDTSPAVMGMGQSAQQSQMRQRLGTRGGLQARQQTGSLGLAVMA
jgi:hypothetical protein